MAIGLGATAIGVGVLTSGSASAAPTSSAAGQSIAVSPASISAAAKKKLVKSNVSQLRKAGVTIGEPVLIDVADDGLNRYLSVKANSDGVVDFSGKRRTENTQMTMTPAWVAKTSKPAKNRVVIKPDWYNEDLGPGQCVTDVSNGQLELQNCKKGKANQTFKLTLEGDSGQFSMKAPTPRSASTTASSPPTAAATSACRPSTSSADQAVRSRRGASLCGWALFQGLVLDQQRYSPSTRCHEPKATGSSLP